MYVLFNLMKIKLQIGHTFKKKKKQKKKLSIPANLNTFKRKEGRSLCLYELAHQEVFTYER